MPVPEATRKKRKEQNELDLEEEETENNLINRIRGIIEIWRNSPTDKWGVTHTTRQLLIHWREAYKHRRDNAPAPFFCQVEAMETLIWLNEIAPRTKEGVRILGEIKKANEEANPNLLRYAAKMATGSGKTTVMAMLIAYHTLNKQANPKSPDFSKNFLIITPGITIKDRLRVLKPSDPRNYYQNRGIIPPQLNKREINAAKIEITNYHAFRKRELMEASRKVKMVLRGNEEKEIENTESNPQMLQRACKGLEGREDVIIINDEAHHCYRRKIAVKEEKLDKDDKEELEKHQKAARLWISGIEILGERTKIKDVYDLSATPFFLKGSGYPEGRLFPWVISDFSLLDAIECGIVKLPRVPVEGSAAGDEPQNRHLYKLIKNELPKKGRSKQGKLDPQKLPVKLNGALQTLHDHYEKTFEAWKKKGHKIPPVFIIVCNNTSVSKLIYDYVSGYEIDGQWKRGKFELFSNVNKDGRYRDDLRTLLIDSEQLEGGETLSKSFKEAAAPVIAKLKKKKTGKSKLTDGDMLREIVNTVGKEGEWGEQIRCVVSVSMLSEGWDAQNVTHILGVRAFGTQLLCEQVVGRALRRFSYDLEEGQELYKLEYADIFGVPFSFARGSEVNAPDAPPCRVRALEERRHLEITFPRVDGYKYKFPNQKIVAEFNENSRLVITPEDVPPETRQQGIIGKGEILTLAGLKKYRLNEVVFAVAKETHQKFADEDNNVHPGYFRDLVPITRRWMNEYLRCLGGTFEQYLIWKEFSVKAAERIYRACNSENENKEEMLMPILNYFNPEGSSKYVNSLTSKKRLHPTDKNKCHVNIAVCDSDWELDFCKFLEQDPGVYCYVRHFGLNFRVPYEYNGKMHDYWPDFIAKVDDGKGADDPLNLVIEVKGFRPDKDRMKADTMEKSWIPAVNNYKKFGRWQFLEIMDMQDAREKLAKFTKGARLIA